MSLEDVNLDENEILRLIDVADTHWREVRKQVKNKPRKTRTSKDWKNLSSAESWLVRSQKFKRKVMHKMLAEYTLAGPGGTLHTFQDHSFSIFKADGTEVKV